MGAEIKPNEIVVTRVEMQKKKESSRSGQVAPGIQHGR